METTGNNPRAWVGCLACYNSGRLRGAWITAEEMADEIAAEAVTFKGLGVAAQYPDGAPFTACAVCGGDEWDLMDSENIPTSVAYLRGFMENAETLAEMDEEHLERLQVLAGWLGSSTSLGDLLEYDEEHYCGQWAQFQEYAEQFADEVGLLDDVRQEIANYFDWESWSRDLEIDYYHDSATGHTWRSC